MTRVVLDTNVVVSALLWGGTPRLFLLAGRRGKVELFSSLPLIVELTETLGRSKFAAKITASGLTIDQIVDGYAALVKVVRAEQTPRITVDPDDDVVIGTAQAAKADLIVTGDLHLLTVESYDGIRIVTASGAMRFLGLELEL